MSETPRDSKSQKKKKTEPRSEPELEHSDPNSGAIDDTGQEAVQKKEPENDQNVPDWLLELESKPAVIPFETVAQESYPDRDRSDQGSGPDAPVELPDWLKLDRQAPVRPEQQAAPEDEIPEWLRKGLEELKASESAEALEEPSDQASGNLPPESISIPPIIAHSTDLDEWPEPLESRPVGSHPLPSWLVDPDQADEMAVEGEQSTQPDQPETEALLEVGASTQPAQPDLEVLADVRQTLKEDELSEPPQKKPGLLERMAGPILASRLIRTDHGDEELEDESDQLETQPLGAAGEEEPESPEFPAELLTGPVDKPADHALDAETASRSEDLIFSDELGEGAGESMPVTDYSIGEFEEDASVDEDLRREILTDFEASEDGSLPQSADQEKEKKSSLRGRFGLKKTDSPEDTTISDEELERRLLIALAGATGLDDSPPAAAEATEERETTPSLPEEEIIAQEEEFNLDFLDKYEGEETILDVVDEEPGPVDLESTADEWTEVSPLTGLDQAAPVKEPEVEVSEAGQAEIDLREVALQDYVESPQEPEGGPVDIFIEKAVRRFNKFSLAQKIALAALVLANVALVFVLGIIILLSLFPSQPASPNIAPTSTIPRVSGPHPVQVILPGGWSFDVKPGALREGAWQNQGAEWLQGTEITRWIALPWSKQLEAVAITLQPSDHVELVMSNQDRLKYKIDSVVEVPVEKVAELNLNSPSLLLILANQDSDTRVVVIGSLITDE